MEAEDISLSPNLNTREKHKFDYDSDIGTVVKTLAKIVSGEINIKAPTGPFEITVGTATDTATNPLIAPLADRVSLSIRNKGTETIYFGKTAAVTADDTVTGGWEVGPGEDFNIDLQDTQSFYLITESGKTATYKILEIASV